MAGEVIALKLVLDAVGATKEVSKVAKSFDGLANKAGQIATNLNNTIRGRVLRNLAGVVRDNVKTFADESIPEQLKALEAQPRVLGAATGAALGTKAGQFVQGAASRALQGQIGAARAGANTVSQLQAIFPATPLPQEAVRRVFLASATRHSAILEARHVTARQVSKVLASKEGKAVAGIDQEKIRAAVALAARTALGSIGATAKTVVKSAPAILKGFIPGGGGDNTPSGEQ